MAEELLSEKLKIRTLAAHQQLEKQLVFQLRSMHNKEDYIHILQWFYSYFAALEQRIICYINSEQLPDMPKRRKSGNILLDLTALHGKIPMMAPEEYLPEITNLFQAFGALYVMEGSTLGGQVICKMIEKLLNLNTGMSFFQGYGDHTQAMWTAFRRVLDEQPEQDLIIKSADETFIKFSLWITRSIAH
jgi:heme oxygenase